MNTKIHSTTNSISPFSQSRDTLIQSYFYTCLACQYAFTKFYYFTVYIFFYSILIKKKPLGKSTLHPYQQPPTDNNGYTENVRIFYFKTFYVTMKPYVLCNMNEFYKFFFSILYDIVG